MGLSEGREETNSDCQICISRTVTHIHDRRTIHSNSKRWLSILFAASELLRECAQCRSPWETNRGRRRIPKKARPKFFLRFLTLRRSVITPICQPERAGHVARREIYEGIRALKVANSNEVKTASFQFRHGHMWRPNVLRFLTLRTSGILPFASQSAEAALS